MAVWKSKTQSQTFGHCCDAWCCSSIVQLCEENVQFTEGKCNIALHNVASSFHFNSIDKTKRPMHIAISKATTQIYWRITWLEGGLAYNWPGQTWNIKKVSSLLNLMREIYITADVECKSAPHWPVHILNTRHFPCQLFPACCQLPAGHGGPPPRRKQEKWPSSLKADFCHSIATLPCY